MGGGIRPEAVRAQPPSRCLDQRVQPTADRRGVPLPAVLVLEQDRRTVRAGPGREARGGQLTQREQAVHLGLIRLQRGQRAGQPDRLVRQVGAQQPFPDVAVDPSVKIT